MAENYSKDDLALADERVVNSCLLLLATTEQRSPDCCFVVRMGPRYMALTGAMNARGRGRRFWDLGVSGMMSEVQSEDLSLEYLPQ